MKMVDPANDVDLNEYEMEDRRTLVRRYTTYSTEALRAALPIDDVFVAHPQFIDAVNAVSRVYELAGKTGMPQGICLEGPFGTGKTSVLRYFAASLPQDDLFSPRHDVIGIRAKKSSSAGNIVSSILRKHGYPIRRTGYDTLEPRIHVTKEAIRHKQGRLLWIDEASNILGSASRRTTSHMEEGTTATDLICELMDETGIGIALVGTERLSELEKTESALASRLTAHQRLDNFEFDDTFVAFATTFLRQCAGFDFSFFLIGERMRNLHRVTRGNARTFKRFITECGLCVAQRGVRMLIEADAAKAFRAIFGSTASAPCPYASAA
jgi:hypothetical protein